MDQYFQVLKTILLKPQRFQSDFSRSHASFIAEAASRGHITCLVDGKVRWKWYVTGAGLEVMQSNGIQI